MEISVFKKELLFSHSPPPFPTRRRRRPALPDLNLPRIPNERHEPAAPHSTRVVHFRPEFGHLDLNKLASMQENNQEHTFIRRSGTSALDPIIISDDDPMYDATSPISLAVKSESSFPKSTERLYILVKEREHRQINNHWAIYACTFTKINVGGFCSCCFELIRCIPQYLTNFSEYYPTT